MTSGHIKVYRKILDWEWYKNTNTKVVFIHMVLKAYWKNTKIEGVIITRGSFISSVKKLAEETSLTYSQVRRAVNNLKKTGEITTRSTNRFTIFTVENFDLYQSSGERVSGQNWDCKQYSREPWNDDRAYEMITKYGFSKPLADKTIQWLKYKYERGERFGRTAFDTLIERLAAKSEEYGDSAVIELIDECMSNGWKGIIWDKLAGGRHGGKAFNYEQRSWDFNELDRLKREELIKGMKMK